MELSKPKPVLYSTFSRGLYRTQNVPVDHRLTLSELTRGNQTYRSSDLDPSKLTPGSLLGNFELAQGAIQSPNYVASTAGWKVSSDGTSEFN